MYFSLKLADETTKFGMFLTDVKLLKYLYKNSKLARCFENCIYKSKINVLSEARLSVKLSVTNYFENCKSETTKNLKRRNIFIV